MGKDGQFDFCTVVMGEARIMLMRAPGETLSPVGTQPVEIYLEVEDVDALHNRLKLTSSRSRPRRPDAYWSVCLKRT